MSSSTRLLVLGVVRTFQPVHGYVVRRELMSWRANEWAGLKTGSIYNALKTLEQDGFIEVTGTDQVGGRPERTTYRITAPGIEQHNDLLRTTWWQVHPVTDPLMAGIAFLSHMPRAQAISALEHRVTQIRGISTYLAHALDALDADEAPEHVREMILLSAARSASEIAWADAFAARLREGHYVTADDEPWAPASAIGPKQKARKQEATRAHQASAAKAAASNAKAVASVATNAKPAASMAANAKPAAAVAKGAAPAAHPRAAASSAATRVTAKKPRAAADARPRRRGRAGGAPGGRRRLA